MIIKNKLYNFKEKGKKESNSSILQFNIKLKEAISKLKKFLLINNFEWKIFTGTAIIKKNKKKLNIICKNSIILLNVITVINFIYYLKIF